MICWICKQEDPDGAFCIFFETKQEINQRNQKQRGNGQGSVIRKPTGNYVAV